MQVSSAMAAHLMEARISGRSVTAIGQFQLDPSDIADVGEVKVSSEEDYL